MDVLGYQKSSLAFYLNGIAMTVVFFFSRIAIIPQYYYSVYSIYGTDGYFRLGMMWYVLISSCVVLDTLNLFWMVKILRGIVKLLGKTKSSQKLLEKKID